MKQIVSVIAAFLTAAVILTGAIAVPILVRPFYYAHIKPLGIESSSGLSETQIKDAYNDVLDFCLGKSDEFSAGVLNFSTSGASHFSDVKRLVQIDISIFIVSLILLIIIKPRKSMYRGALCLGALVFAAGIFAALNFGKAFELFHKLLFPNKTNWVLSAATDPVITILPMAFFRNCSILIAAVMLVLILLVTILDKKILTRR